MKKLLSLVLILATLFVSGTASADMGPPWLWINGKWKEQWKSGTPPPEGRPDYIIPGWGSNDPNDPNPVPIHPDWAPGGKYADPEPGDDSQKKIALVMVGLGVFFLTWERRRSRLPISSVQHPTQALSQPEPCAPLPRASPEKLPDESNRLWWPVQNPDPGRDGVTPLTPVSCASW